MGDSDQKMALSRLRAASGSSGPSGRRQKPFQKCHRLAGSPEAVEGSEKRYDGPMTRIVIMPALVAGIDD